MPPNLNGFNTTTSMPKSLIACEISDLDVAFSSIATGGSSFFSKCVKCCSDLKGSSIYNICASLSVFNLS